MPAPLLSTSEASYIFSGLSPASASGSSSKGDAVSTPFSRFDGRGPYAYRPIHVSDAETVTPRVGAADRVELGGTIVEAVVSSKVEETGGGDGFMVDVEWSSHLTNTPGYTTSSLDVLCTTLTSLLQGAFGPFLSDPAALSALSILPASPARKGRRWCLTLDVRLAGLAGGNVVDATLLAARCALWRVRIPRTRVVAYDAAPRGALPAGAGTQVPAQEAGSSMLQTQSTRAGNAQNTAQMATDGSTPVDFELDTESEGLALPDRDELPVGVTINFLPLQPPHPTHFLDATLAEESVLPPSSRLLILASPSGKVRGVRLLRVAESEAEGRGGGDGATLDETGTDTSAATRAASDVSAKYGPGLEMGRLVEGIKLGTEYAQQLLVAVRPALVGSEAQQ